MGTEKLKPAKLFIWDIDNVLYAYDAAFWNMIHEAAATAAVKLTRGGLGFEQAKSLAAQSQAETNSSTNIFIQQYGVDRAEMIGEFVSALRYDFIKPNHEFIECFRRSSAMHAAVTHNSFGLAKEIVNRCGLSSYIPDDRIISVRDINLPLKHEARGAFEHLLTITGIAPKDAVMIEDTPANLRHPKEMGMQTVLIERDQAGDKSHAQHVFAQPVDFMKAYLKQVAQPPRIRGQY